MDRTRHGFASMDVARQREIASSGGRASHAKGTGHEYTSEEARLHGRLGGHLSHVARKLGRKLTADEKAEAKAAFFAANHHPLVGWMKGFTTMIEG